MAKTIHGAELHSAHRGHVFRFIWVCATCGDELLSSEVPETTPIRDLERLDALDRQLVELALAHHDCRHRP